MSSLNDISSIKEPARETPVFRETDVLVVGGGPAGIGAAIAAARAGARTALLERYGHLGGLATGGMVICIMPMSDGGPELQITGICQEIVQRLDAEGGAVHPTITHIGSGNQELLNQWRSYPFGVVDDRVRFSVQFDPEKLKCVLNDMIEESGVELLLHSLACQAIVESNSVNGIIFESKSGRQAIKARVVIDCTGDGDILASAGAEYDDALDPALRSSKLALIFRLGNIDVPAYMNYKTSYPERHAHAMKELEQMGGYTMALRAWRDDVVWVNNFIADRNALDVGDLTRVEIEARKAMLLTIRFFKDNIPGFKNAWLMDTASQIGVRCSRRLKGNYVVTSEDVRSGIIYEDTIAVCPTFLPEHSPRGRHMHIPYRSLVPKDVDSLIVAGRCFSSDSVANDLLSPIQFCVAMGQAAGAAAALTVRNGERLSDIEIQRLRAVLLGQGVHLP